MANQLHKFKHRDVVRVVKAARAAGVAVDQVTVDPHTGAITVATSAQAAQPLPGNALDQWMTGRADQTERR
jgi:hypothetical protein